MKELNEYQLRNLKQYEESARRLRLIVDELNKIDFGDVTEFELQPIPKEYDFTPRYIAITALIPSGKLEIMCERDGYGNANRWEFRAAGWPTYTDEGGRNCTIDPSNLWNPKANRPVTTAAQDREPKAIAKQIASKVIPDYLDIFARCWFQAGEFQVHSDERADGLRRLAEACRDERDSHNGSARASFYVRDLEGDTVSVDSNSHGDVTIRLHTDEMVAVIGLLRELRA
jgi:hypothetical protein